MADANVIYENLENRAYPQRQQTTPNLLQTTKNQVDELVEIVYENVDQVLQRKEKLEDLNVISENLERGAGDFKTAANEVKRKEWRKRMKIKLIFTAIITLLLIGLILLMVYLL